MIVINRTVTFLHALSVTMCSSAELSDDEMRADKNGISSGIDSTINRDNL
jgi:hypothetical protein